MLGLPHETQAGAVEEDGRLRTFVIYAKYLRKILRKIQWLGGCGSAVLTRQGLCSRSSSFRRAATHEARGRNRTGDLWPAVPKDTNQRSATELPKPVFIRPCPGATLAGRMFCIAYTGVVVGLIQKAST